MVERAFVDNSVALQIGAFTGPVAQGEAALARALQRCSGMAIAFRPDLGAAFAPDESGVGLRQVDIASLPVKTTGALAALQAAGVDFDFILDMQDRRAKRMAPNDELTPPVFAFNRLQGDGRRILMPLPIYHDFGTGHFVDAVRPDAVAWADKVPRVVWRGITGGRAALDAEGLVEGMRIKMALRRLREGRMTEAQVREVLAACPRWGLLERLRDDPRFDLGFVDGDGYVIAQTPLHSHLERPRMPQAEMQRFRYVAVLRGLDVGSSFYWVMHSGSLGLVMETPFETFASGHFRPGEAYLPFRLDGSDLATRLDWAEAHPAEVQAMVAQAAQISALLLRADLRAEILRRVVAQVAAQPRVQE